MSPPIPIDLPPIEHQYMLDKKGSLIFIAPTNIDQFHQSTIEELQDWQLDLIDLLKAIEEKDIRRIVKIIDTMPISFRKQTKKLFAQIGELKKNQLKLEYNNQMMQEQIDYLYSSLNIQKRAIDDICNLCQ